VTGDEQVSGINPQSAVRDPQLDHQHPESSIQYQAKTPYLGASEATILGN
jgi:hypothetical protein